MLVKPLTYLDSHSAKLKHEPNTMKLILVKQIRKRTTIYKLNINMKSAYY